VEEIEKRTGNKIAKKSSSAKNGGKNIMLKKINSDEPCISIENREKGVKL
jgi:hypothetical protein